MGTHDLGIGSGGSGTQTVAAEEPSMYGGHATICIRRESVDGFVHSGLNSNDEVLCGPGRAWASKSGDQLVEWERGEAVDNTVYALLLLE